MHTKIESTDNFRIKHIKKLLTDKEYRYASKEYIIEGSRAIEGSLSVKELFVRQDKKIPDIKCKNIFIVAENVFDKLSDTENSQGVIAVSELKIEGIKEVLKTSRYVLLDKLQDPGNMGTIIRTALAFRFDGVIITPGCVDPFSPKVVRSTMGALDKIKIIKIDSISELKSHEIISADKGGIDLAVFIWPSCFILAIGNEANGLSKTVKDQSSSIVAIPISDKIESLNAAISCGILLYSSTNCLGSLKIR